MKKIISSEQIPKPIGPYSTAVISDNCLYTSGQIALDKTTFELINGTMKEQTLIVLDNIDSILTEIGISKQSILKLTVYVTDLSQFNEVNDAFKLFFENFKNISILICRVRYRCCIYSSLNFKFL